MEAKFFECATNPESCGRLIWISFLFGDVTRSSPVLYHEYCIQDGNLNACSVANIPGGVLGTRMNPDTCRLRVHGQIRFEYGYVWTWKILNQGKKKLRIQKYPDTSGWGHRIAYANDELWNSQG